jgi:glyoxylase-like metal-dependent hydrolase (beta-lactamase superfamily II)
MNLFFQYCSIGFSNCYILGKDEEGKKKQNAAILIDPGSMENVTLDAIENNNFDLKAVLITHDHLHHVRGLRTLKRIYNAEIFAVNHIVQDHKATIVKDGD